MIKILGAKATNARVEEESKANGSGGTTRKTTPGQIRLSKDMAQIDIPKNAKVKLPEGDVITTFEVTVKPEEGSYWFGGTYNFTVNIPDDYPQEPPKIHCNTKIYHPNIDFEGKVCLNILRQDWRPVLDINNVILGLLFLFIEPNPNDPLNQEAAELMRADRGSFGDVVRKTLRGQSYKGHIFTKMI